MLALETGEWYEPPAYETQTSSNLSRAIFTSGAISVRQQAVESGKNNPTGKKETVSGQKVWVWQALLPISSGSDWASDTHDRFVSAAQLSLADVVSQDYRNPHMRFEKKEDGWILIKM